MRNYERAAEQFHAVLDHAPLDGEAKVNIRDRLWRGDFTEEQDVRLR